VHVLSGDPVPVDLAAAGEEQQLVMVAAGESIRIESAPPR
jgi:hypothetical protein